MSKSTKGKEQTVASEVFSPSLNEEYRLRFQAIVMRLKNTLPMNYIKIINNELSGFNMDEKEDIECKKYMASLRVLIDLSQQGWILAFQDNQLILKMENTNIDDKAMIRYRLSTERNAQFNSESVIKFVKYMETERTYKNLLVSIKCLIGDKNRLIEAINREQLICEPYIQIVDNSRDKYTGYRLSDIWRYFRYTWSIPYKTMPGRNLYYLVRDRLQPFHPIIGIFALGNSVLNLTVRDDDIGWTVEAIKAEMEQKTHIEYCKHTVSGTDGKTVNVKIHVPI